MEHSGGSLETLILVVLVSFLIPIVLYQFRITALPVVVAEIMAGLVLGKSGLNLVKDDPWVSLLSLLGFIYLMFLCGLEIDISALQAQKKHNRRRSFHPLLVASVIFSVIFIISGFFAYSLYQAGLVERVFLMTLIISTVSLGVVVAVLKEKKLLSEPLGQTLLLITVIADFVSMILLAIYISYLSNSMSQLLMLFIFFTLVVIIYLLIKMFSGGKVFQVLSESTVQFGTRAIFALLLIIVFLSESLGAENILGAFLAGVIVSLMRPGKRFVHQLESFGYGFLIPIFFVMVGVNLEIWPLLTDVKILILIPLLLVMLFLSKIVPVLLLRRWFSWREVMGSGLLLSCTLSLVIAASTLALELKIIDNALHGALILVAILSCVLFPVLFNRVAPKEEVPKQIISIIGMNHVSATVVQDLTKEEGYELRIYTTHAANLGIRTANNQSSLLNVYHVPDMEVEGLEKTGAFEADVVVFATMEDEVNLRLARSARSRTSGRILVRIEKHDLQAKISREGFGVFSTLFASRTMLRALIENPAALQPINESADRIHEVTVHNLRYHMVKLRQLPLLDHLLILRIYRGESFVIPQGNTEIRRADRLLISGEVKQVEMLRRMLA